MLLDAGPRLVHVRLIRVGRMCIISPTHPHRSSIQTWIDLGSILPTLEFIDAHPEWVEELNALYLVHITGKEPDVTEMRYSAGRMIIHITRVPFPIGGQYYEIRTTCIPFTPRETAFHEVSTPDIPIRIRHG